MFQKLILRCGGSRLSWCLGLVILGSSITASPVKAQSIEQLKIINATSHYIAQAVPVPPPQDVIPQPQPPTTPSTSDQKPESLPPPEELLRPEPLEPPPTPSVPPNGKVGETNTVKRFESVGNTAISDEELNKLLTPFLNRPLSFAQISEAPKAIAQLYIQRGYITSSALLPAQATKDGVVTIVVVEGSIEAINISGTRRLDPDYIRSRLPSKTEPFNQQQLLEALQLLQLNPLIRNISAVVA